MKIGECKIRPYAGLVLVPFEILHALVGLVDTSLDGDVECPKLLVEVSPILGMVGFVE
jgi:hypothetical protein